MICWFDARETYSDKTKDFAWYFHSRLWFVDLVHEKLRFWQKKRQIARYFQYRLDRSVHEKLILTLTKNFAWYFQYRLWFVDLVHETYSDRTKNFAWYFQYRLWFADLMRENARETFPDRTKDFLDTFGFVDFMQEKLILTEQRNSLDSFNMYYDFLMHEQLIYRTKGVPWYLPIYCDLLREKLILTEQGLRMIPFNMLWFVVWETYVFNKVISTRDYLVLRSL